MLAQNSQKTEKLSTLLTRTTKYNLVGTLDYIIFTFNNGEKRSIKKENLKVLYQTLLKLYETKEIKSNLCLVQELMRIHGK